MLGIALRPGHQGLSTTAAAPARRLVLAIGAGQSNELTFNADREAGDPTTRPHVYTFHGGPASPADYRTINQTLPPKGRQNYYTLNPGKLSQAEFRAQHLLDLGYCDDVLMVPCASGSTDLCTPGLNWYPGPAGGANNGTLFENMIAQANLAHSAARAQFPAHTVEVALFWCQGEDDGNNSVPQSAYQARFAAWVQHARARIAGAADATVVQGSMVPDKWSATGGAATTAHRAINRAHVGNSLPAAEGGIAGVFYSRGSDLDDLVGNDNLHYFPASYAREHGRRMAAVYVRARTVAQGTGPVMTSANAQTVQSGNPFSLSLAAAGATHKTFHIVGGADAALFERSDPYDNPRARMLGDGSVPAVGSYALEIAARDGAGIYGPAQAITLTVAAAPVIADVSYAASSAAPATQTLVSGVGNALTFPARDFVAGLAAVFVFGTTREPSAVTVNGVPASKVVTSGTTNYASIWTAPLAASGSFDVVLTFAGSVASITVASGTLVGAASGASDSALKPAGSVTSPAAASSTLEVPAHGAGLACCRANTGATFVTWQNAAAVERFELPVSGAYRASGASYLGGANGLSFAPSFASESGQGQAIAAAAWALAA